MSLYTDSPSNDLQNMLQTARLIRQLQVRLDLIPDAEIDLFDTDDPGYDLRDDKALVRAACAALYRKLTPIIGRLVSEEDAISLDIAQKGAR